MGETGLTSISIEQILLMDLYKAITGEEHPLRKSLEKKRKALKSSKSIQKQEEIQEQERDLLQAYLAQIGEED